jgi:hypothetical protein
VGFDAVDRRQWNSGLGLDLVGYYLLARKVEGGKFAMQGKYKIVVSLCRFFRRSKVSEVHPYPIAVGSCSPHISFSDYTLESTGAINPDPSIRGVLNFRDRTKIAASIIESVVVDVIRHVVFGNSRDNRVHAHSLLRSLEAIALSKSSDGVAGATLFAQPRCLPVPLNNERIVVFINDSVKSSRKRDGHALDSIDNQGPSLFATLVTRRMPVYESAWLAFNCANFLVGLSRYWGLLTATALTKSKGYSFVRHEERIISCLA